MRLCLLAIAVLAGGCSALADELSSIEAVKRLTRVEAAKGLPVRMTGVVAHRFDWVDRPFTLADLQDPTDTALFVRPIKDLSCTVKVGDVLEILGTTSAGRLVPGVYATQIVHRGTMAIPVPDVRRLADLKAISQNNPLVSLVGIPRTYRLTSSDLTLSQAIQMDIQTPDGPFTAQIQLKNPADWNAEKLIDAEILIRGCLSPFYNQRAEFLGIRLHVSGTNDVVVLKPAPEDPFILPLTPLDEVLPISASSQKPHRKRVSGVVTFLRQNVVYIQDQQHALKIITHTNISVRLGAVIDAVGFPAMRNCFAELNEALVRQTGQQPPPDPLLLSPDVIAASRRPNPGETAKDIDGLLVRMSGRIVQIGEPVHQQRSILFRSAGTVYTAFIEEQDGVHSFVRDLPQNQPVEVTGILVFQRPAEQQEHFPQDWNLLLRGTADIRILPGGPWLTRQREIGLQLLTGLLLLFAIAVIIRLRIRIRNQKQRQHDIDLLLTERKRIAADLHDTLQQNLAGISLQVQTALKATETAPSKVASFLQMTRQALDDAHAMLRTSVWDLRSEVVDGKSLEQAVTDLAQGLSEHTLTCRLQCLPRKLPLNASVQLLAVIKESITNILKHAQATEIVITASAREDGFQITIDDNGKGFDTTAFASNQAGHYGLTGMRERMRRINGLCQVESEPGHGTRVILTFPCSNLKEES